MSDREPVRDAHSSVVPPEKLRAIDDVFSRAWQRLDADGLIDKRHEREQRDRLARIALECLVDGLEPTTATVDIAVERFLARRDIAG